MNLYKYLLITTISIALLCVNSNAQTNSEKLVLTTSLCNGNTDSAPNPLPCSTQYTQIYTADSTGLLNQGAYSHHAHVVNHAGIIYAAWSNHLRDEDCPGQRVFMRYSKDEGKTWIPNLDKEPMELFPSIDNWIFCDQPIVETNRSGTCNGFALINKGKNLYAINEVLPAISMQDKGIGRLARRIYDNGSLGDLFWLESESPVSPNGFKTYPNLSHPKYKKTGTEIISYLNDKTRAHLPTWDFKGARNTTTEIEPGNEGSPIDNHALCEPTTSFAIKGNLLAMLWRDLGGNRRQDKSYKLYMNYSSDGGNNWSLPIVTSISDASSKPFAGNLPDGTPYLINNPGGFGYGNNSRRHLILSLATDGLHFDKHYTIREVSTPMRYKGQYKGSYAAAYPHACITGEYLYIIYSINKEDIEVCQVNLSHLLNTINQ